MDKIRETSQIERISLPMNAPALSSAPIIRLLALGTLWAGLSGLTGCNSTSSASRSTDGVVIRSFDPESGRRDSRGARHRPSGQYYSRFESRIAYAAFKHWESDFRDQAFTYELDPYNPKISPPLRKRIDADLPRPERLNPDAHRVFAFERIERPEDNWAYVVYREGNKYHSIEYTTVFRIEGEEIERVDHFTIAEGLMDPVLLDFQWPVYRKLHVAPREAASAATP